ncbi:hypothetical protein NQ314_020111 [Rhamnusium bicolor]|uniref:Tetraspanin n=1 Tax=Rhamnusium bicolor TaxID=1586634 RepID=A0AAV8WML9_9CUCU|nr:hypothetical protein NQ314_020111 [Rhamnusium bicolor]
MLDCAAIMRNYSRYLLVFFNLIFSFTGIIIISVGFSAKAYYHEFDTFLDDKYIYVSDLLIIIGVVIFFIAFFGCCGAIKENACMTTTFSTLLIVIFILEVVAAVSGILLKSKTEALLVRTLEETIHQYNNNTEITKVWDRVQNEKIDGHIKLKEMPSPYGSLYSSARVDTQQALSMNWFIPTLNKQLNELQNELRETDNYILSKKLDEKISNDLGAEAEQFIDNPNGRINVIANLEKDLNNMAERNNQILEEISLAKDQINKYLNDMNELTKRNTEKFETDLENTRTNTNKGKQNKDKLLQTEDMEENCVHRDVPDHIPMKNTHRSGKSKVLVYGDGSARNYSLYLRSYLADISYDIGGFVKSGVHMGEFKCCGVNNYTNWIKDNDSTNHTLPLSCCEIAPGTTDKFECTAKTAYQIGCLEEFGNYVRAHTSTIEGVGIGLAIVQLLGILLSCYLAKSIRSDYETV